MVNNASINAGYENPPSRTRLNDMHAIFGIDVFGVVAVTTACVSLLRKSVTPRIVNVSSYCGSLGSVATWAGSWPTAYGTAKSALNSITVHYAREPTLTPPSSSSWRSRSECAPSRTEEK
jgi:NAD(P)-dependent dehydrogenase (short-subunit alcohol dehydrogenase family)